MAINPTIANTAGRHLCLCGRCRAGPGPGPGRRAVLTAAGGALLAATLGRPALAQTASSPDAALAQLMEGNTRYVQGRPNPGDFAAMRKATAQGQQPFAAVLGCADSRVPVELVFDETVGQIFTCRVAGNICTPEIVGSIEYGVAVLGTPLVMVLGHQDCGAVAAAIAGKSVPGDIGQLFPPLHAAIEKAGPDLNAVVKANALVQADLLRTRSPVIAAASRQGKVKVVAAYYSLVDGTVTMLG